MIRIRSMQRRDLPAYGRLVHYCFGLSEDYRHKYIDFMSKHLDTAWCASDGDTLAAGMWCYPFRMRVGEQFVPMSGVAAVATAPEYRNSGLAREMMTRAHAELRKAGYALSALMPFRHDFYARMGYADVFHHWDAVFAPAQIAPVTLRGIRVREVDGTAEWKTLDMLQRAFGRRYLGPVTRDRRYWSFRWLLARQGLRRVHLVSRASQPIGYVISEMDIEPPAARWPTRDELSPVGRKLAVKEAVWADDDALSAILQLLRSYRDHAGQITWFLPVDIPILDFLSNPIADVRLVSKMQFKLIDFKRAIEERHYPADLDGAVSADVQGDPTSEWNDGRWLIRWSGGRARVTRSRTTKRGVPRASGEIAAWSVLYSGHLVTAELVQQKRLTANAGAVEILERAFPPQVCFMPEWF